MTRSVRIRVEASCQGHAAINLGAPAHRTMDSGAKVFTFVVFATPAASAAVPVFQKLGASGQNPERGA
jgi:hypothetical protein